MSIGLLALVAAVPMLVALVLMVGLRLGAMKAMPIAWLAGVVLASLVPVVLTAFLCIPFILGGHPGNERLVDAGTAQHMS